MKLGKMKFVNLIFDILVIFLTVIWSGNSLAQEMTFPQRTVLVGYSEYPGYNEMDEDGNKRGYGYEFLRMIAPYANLKYEYVGYNMSWAEAMDMLDKGQVHLLTGARKDIDKNNRFAFDNHGIGTNFTILVTDYMQTAFKPGDISSYKDLHVGMMRGSGNNESFERFASQNNLSYTVRYYDSLRVMHADLRDGSLNAIVTGDSRTIQKFETVLERFDSAPFYAITRKDDADLMARINYAVSKLDIDDPNWRSKLNQDYFINVKYTDINLTFDERLYLTKLRRQHKPITVLINPDRAPYASVNADGEPEGIFYDLLKQAAEQCDFDYKLISTRTTQEYNTATTQGLADVVFDSPSTLSDSEKKGYNSTSSYYDGNFAEIYRKGKSDFKTVAVKTGASNMNSVYKTMYGDKKIIEYPSVDACIEAVKTGKADCCYMYTYTAANYVAADVQGALAYEPVRGHHTKFRIAVRNDADPLLYSIMNKFSESVTDNTMRSLIARHRVDEKQTFTTYVYRNPVNFVLAVISFILVIIGFFAYMQMKRRTVEQKKEAEIRRVKNMLDEMTASFPMGIFSYSLDDRKVILSNGEAKRLLSNDFTVGTELTEDYFVKNIFPEDIAKIFESANKLTKIGDQVDYEFRVKLEDGSYANVMATTTMQSFEDGKKYIITGLKDNTEQIRVNKQLMQERATFRDSLLSKARFTFNLDVDDGYLRENIIDSDGNNIIEKLGLKVPVKYDLVGEKVKELFGIQFENKELEIVLSCAGLKKYYAAGYKAETPEYYMEKIDKYARTQCFLYEDLSNGHLMATFFSYDITASVKEEMAKRALLKESMAATDRANAAKTEFLSQMSHDIRTPMNAIIGMTTIAAAHLDDRNRVEDCLEKIDTSSKHLLGLINEVLDMSKIEAGKVILAREVFDMNQLVDNLIVMTKMQLLEKKHKLIVNLNGIEHKKVVGDKDRVQQIFMNFMTNAIKYTPEGGEIRFTIVEKPSRLHDYAIYECVFEDNGIGMTPEFINEIFEPFSRAQDSRTSKIQGTGLGMSIAKSIVNMMNGTIDIESEVNVGSKFTVKILLELPEKETVAEISLPENSLSDLGETHFGGKRALIVDDNEINAEILGEILSMTGMSIEYASNGKDVIELIKDVQPGYYDIIFMDIQMPGIDGYTATRTIRRIPGEYYQKVPIFAMTANAFTEDVENSRKAGMNEHISKPVDISKLMNALNRWI